MTYAHVPPKLGNLKTMNIMFTIISHHQPSSTTIAHHQPYRLPSTIINHHRPSSSISNHHRSSSKRINRHQASSTTANSPLMSIVPTIAGHLSSPQNWERKTLGELAPFRCPACCFIWLTPCWVSSPQGKPGSQRGGVPAVSLMAGYIPTVWRKGSQICNLYRDNIEIVRVLMWLVILAFLFSTEHHSMGVFCWCVRMGWCPNCWAKPGDGQRMVTLQGRLGRLRTARNRRGINWKSITG